MALVVENAVKELEELNKVNETIKNKKKNYFYEAIEQLLTTTSVKCLSFVGHTPYFNDGDPCEHSEDCWLFTSSPLDEKESEEDDEDEEEVDYSSEEGSVWAGDLKDKDVVKPLWSLMHDCNYGILEDKHETNYIVKFYLGEDGKVVEDHEYNDRGY
jgi:hypothetical protein